MVPVGALTSSLPACGWRRQDLFIGSLQELEPVECRSLLASAHVGRLAVCQRRGGPLVVPVTYASDGERIVFRSAWGTKLRSLALRPVSFQVDAIDQASRGGWSVLAQGRAEEIHSRAASLEPPEPWLGEELPHLVQNTVARISGRRVGSVGAEGAGGAGSSASR